MAPKTSAIGLDDINAFLQTEADFAFEMSVLDRLRRINCICEHGGTYIDPVTQKRRQFDIRAKEDASLYHLRLSIECKNLRDTSPLLLHAVERDYQESFHDLIVRQAGRAPGVVRVSAYESTYVPNDFVAKATDQVTRREDGSFKRSDADVFDKMSQAVNSSFDLFIDGYNSGLGDVAVISIIPMLVVPDERLWQVTYSNSGTQLAPPSQIDYGTFFLNHTWEYAGGVHKPPYTMSHLEIVTLSAVKTRVATHLHSAPPGSKSVFSLREAVLGRTK